MEVLARIHQRAKEQSADRVTALCSSGIERLTIEDICVEGVDFHCSRVLDELLADSQLCGMCLDLLFLACMSGHGGDDAVPESAEGRCSYLEQIWKSFMWNYSLVNHRRPLIKSSLHTTDDMYSELWKDLVAPKALAYQKSYVKQRLAP